jgi:Relaxase/Mobilisation nuclease domain
MSAVLNYNEKKVTREIPMELDDDPPKYAAELIAASGFLKDIDRMNFYDKAERFTQLNSLNTRTQRNMLHISLNFDPAEKNLPKEQLINIADRYMEAIGFKDQPYLVYKHNDAGHPHLHIVTNIIRSDGTRIDTYNIGMRKSEPARKLMEQEFNLVRAEASRHQKKQFELQPVDAQKVIYGNATETKAAMKQAIHEVFDKYKYTSLPEYNAALRQYNVTADPGTKESRINKHGGLVYRVLDEQGNKVGVPIKASSFYFKPTLDNLKEKFEENKERRKADLPAIRQRVDWALTQSDSLREFVSQLQRDGVELVIRQNDDGRIYGLTYIDRNTKTVVNGRDLGKGYSAAPILKHFEETPQLKPSKQLDKPMAQHDSRSQMPAAGGRLSGEPSLPLVSGFSTKVPQFLSNLMEYEEPFGRSPRELEEEQQHRRRKLR